jgi:phosphatidylglycerol:prolipoprotein diacylglycerol transferase
MNYVNTIEFPGLGNGLEIAVNPVAFKLFGFNIYWYGIIISICYLIVVLNSIRKSKEFGIKQDDIIDLVMYAIPNSIIFSRLFYVAVNWGEFKDDPIKIINLRTGWNCNFWRNHCRINFIYIFSRIKKINPVKILDLIALSTPLSMAIGRWGNFINQELYGINTKLPWGMTSPKNTAGA